jgi:aminomethyltransferase
MDKKTPLHQSHLDLKAKMGSYAGYEMPLEYAGTIPEHNGVRNDVGIFDVSHMGEFKLKGKDAKENLDNLLPCDVLNLKRERVRYTPMLNAKGGIVDDLLVYHLKDDEYLLVVNAANIDKDYKWIHRHLKGDVKLEDVSEDYGLIAVQGPKAKELIADIIPHEDIPTPFFSLKENAKFGDVSVLISRTGYTGSFGYEIYCKSEDTKYIWDKLLDVGTKYNVQACGLGSRDSLRLEAGLPLYGNDMEEHIDPLETGLGFSIKLDKEADFVGKKALLEKEHKNTRVGLKVLGRGIVRGGSDVFDGDKKVGVTTSGTKLPYVDFAGALAIIDKKHSELGRKLQVDVRGRKIDVEVVEAPFYKESK